MLSLDNLFARLFFLIKLSLLFVVLCFGGVFLFGFSPAAITVLNLYDSYGLDVSSYRWNEAWLYFKSVFVVANVIQMILLGVWGILFYGLFLMVQLPQSYVTVIVSAINLCLMVFLISIYGFYLCLQVYFDFKVFAGLKLAIIGVFMSFKVLVKFIIGTGACLFILAKTGLLGALLLPVIWLLFSYDVLRPVCQDIEKRFV